MQKLMTGFRSVAFALCALPFAAMAEDPDLPAGFARLDWIQATGETGKQYIKTAYKPATTDKLVMTIEYQPKTEDSNKTACLWCSRVSQNNQMNTVFVLNGSTFRFDFNRANHSAATPTPEADTVYTLTMDGFNQKAYIQVGEGEATKVADLASNEFTPGSVLYLFCSHENGSTLNNYSAYKFIRFTAYDKDGNLLHDYVPACKRALAADDKGRYGVFDLVEWKFLPNSSTTAAFVPSDDTIPQLEKPTVAHWRFDSDHPFRDDSGNENTLTYSGDNHPGLVIADGIVSFRENAGCSLKTAAGKIANYPKTAITFEAFVRRRRGGANADIEPIVGLNQSTLGVAPKSFGITRFGELSAGCYVANNLSTGYTTFKSPMAAVDDVKWHHVAMTLAVADGIITVQSFVDGVSSLAEPITKTAPAGWTTLFSNFIWFSIGGGDSRLDFADVRLTDGVLTPAEFLSQPSLPPSETDGKVVWDSDETVLSAGADVVIPTGANITLTTSTPRLHSLTVEGALTFEGWETKVDADAVVVRKGGLVSAKGPFYGTGTSLSNRVWITCGTLDVEANGEINVAERGFAGVVPSAYRDALGIPAGTARLHPGVYSGTDGIESDGNGRPPSHGGAGCFGLGNDANDKRAAVDVYGSAEWPTTPGTGGASNRLGYEPSHSGGQGGGVVTIEATGAVTVNGRILADGETLRQWTTFAAQFYGCALPGSGGSVLINCTTISGSGLIAANGGDSENNHVNCKGAGGGRIAIHYNTATQDPTAVADLVVSAKGGCLRGDKGAGADSNSTMKQHGQAGTIWLSDGSWVTSGTINHFRGRLINIGALDFAGDLTLDQWVGLGDNGSSLRVRGNLILTNASARLDIGAADAYTGYAARYGYRTTIPSQLVVDGDLTLAEGARLDVHAAATNGTAYTEGAVVSVGGDLTLGAATKLYPMTSPLDGGSVLITAKNIVIDETAVVGLAGAGFTGGNNGAGQGPGLGSTYLYGAGYGGLGGNVTAGGTYGQTYGDAVRPMWPGSGGGAGYYTDAASGGGFIHLVASRSMTVNGTICANGIAAGGNNNGGGGGSGGGIFLETLNLTIGATARITANGGATSDWTGSWKSGRSTAGGGGGRISIWSGKDLWNPEMRKSRYTVSDVVPAEWAEVFSVAGGAQTKDDAQHFAGDMGTIRFVTVKPQPGLVLMVR